MGNTPIYDVDSQATEGLSGAVAVPALAATTAGTFTITNTNIVAGTKVIGAFGRGSTTGAAGTLARLIAQAQLATAGSIVFDVYNAGAAALAATDAVFNYLILT